MQLEQRELALDVIGLRHVGDVDDVDELAELLLDLIDAPVSEPDVTSVRRDTVSSAVGATFKLSML